MWYARSCVRHPSPEDSALVFEYGMSCPISANARREMESLLADGEPAPVYQVDVNAQRDVSDDLAERPGITHESPRVILLRRGRPEWDADRFEVTAGAIGDQLGLAQPVA